MKYTITQCWFYSLRHLRNHSRIRFTEGWNDSCWKKFGQMLRIMKILSLPPSTSLKATLSSTLYTAGKVCSTTVTDISSQRFLVMKSSIFVFVLQPSSESSDDLT